MHTTSGSTAAIAARASSPFTLSGCARRDPEPRGGLGHRRRRTLRPLPADGRGASTTSCGRCGPSGETGQDLGREVRCPEIDGPHRREPRASVRGVFTPFLGFPGPRTGNLCGEQRGRRARHVHPGLRSGIRTRSGCPRSLRRCRWSRCSCCWAVSSMKAQWAALISLGVAHARGLDRLRHAPGPDARCRRVRARPSASSRSCGSSSRRSGSTT